MTNATRLSLLSTLFFFAPVGQCHSATVYELSGQITDAEALTFVVINTVLRSSNPEPNDLPLSYTATLTVPDTTGETTVDFEFSGSFSSSTRAYTFDVGGADIPVSILSNDGSQLQITDSLLASDSLGLEVTLNKASRTGTWSWLDAGRVPVSPALDQTATATISSASFVPEPGTLALAALACCAALRRKR
ncbi:MAG: PEP-CTERM sorting domain-containing protein [Planctomycetota bacterium]